MDIKVKTAFILLSTFLLGIVIGMVGDRTMMNWGHEKWPPRIDSGMFADRTAMMLQLTDEQRKQVMPILSAYGEKMSSLNVRQREGFTILMDSLVGELSAILPKEQVERIRPHGGDFGPRPGGKFGPEHSGCEPGAHPDGPPPGDRMQGEPPQGDPPAGQDH